MLWHVSIPLNDNVNNALKSLMLQDGQNEVQKLYPTKRLVNYFPDKPAEDHIHVIIEPPPSMLSGSRPKYDIFLHDFRLVIQESPMPQYQIPSGMVVLRSTN